MATTKKPNHRLRYEREKRGMSQRKLADLLDTSEEMVSRWERGERKTSPFYQEKLCQLFGKDAVALGFLDPPAFPAPDEASHAVQEEPSPTFLPATVREQTHALDLLLTSPGIAVNHAPACCSTAIPGEVSRRSSAWLTLGASSLGPLFDEGWTVGNVLHALEIVLQGIQAMPAISRRHLIQLGAVAVASSIPIPTRQHISTEDRIKLHQALSESIVSGWKLFHTAGNAQVLAVGQTQLFLVQQNHALLHPQVRSIYYTGVYNLIGRAQHLQEHYEEALLAHTSGHVAALGTGDPLYVAQSLICLADTYQALSQYREAIQSIEEALRSLGHTEEEHLLGCWADNAMNMEDYAVAQKKLEEAAVYIDQISIKEEFDRTSWLQLNGKLALMSGNYKQATAYLEEALLGSPPHWLVRRASILIPLAKANARMQERGASLRVARQTVPIIATMNASMTNSQFAEYLRKDMLELYPHDSEVLTFITDTQHQIPQISLLLN